MISYKKVLFAGISGLAIVLLAGWFLSADLAEGDGTVEVTATVGEVSCSVDATSTAFGNLSLVAVNESTPDILTTMGCEAVPSGCTLYVKGTGDTSTAGLYDGSSYLVTSTDATLSAGTDGYGIQAATSTGTWTINSKYEVTGNNVGGLTITDTEYASSSSGLATSTATTTHKAAISTDTVAGSYTDDIVYSCTAN
jgi:hypothetical protein